MKPTLSEWFESTLDFIHQDSLNLNDEEITRRKIEFFEDALCAIFHELDKLQKQKDEEEHFLEMYRELLLPKD